MKSTPGFYQLKEERQKSRKWFLPRVLLLAAFSGLAQVYLPWWSLIIVCAVIGYFTTLNRSPFLAGFIALFLVWASFAFYLDSQNAHLLSSKVVQLFPLPASSFLLVCITGIFGGIIGGFATLVGHSFQKLIRRVD